MQADGDPATGPRLARDARRRAGSRTPASTTPSTSSPARPTTETAILHASELRELDELSWGELRAQVAAVRRRPARARRRARRPRRRLPAEHPRGDRRLPRQRLDRRGLVELLARLRPGQRRRPLRPDRAQGALRGRRLPLRRQGLRPPRDDRRAAGGDAEPGAHRRPPLPRPRARPLGADATPSRWDELLAAGAGAELELRARPLRPPALGPLLLRHHRAAEGDRPGPGRDPARAPEEAPPPRRRPPRRPPLLVHHDRLDDVELPRLRAADRGGDRPLRRQPRLSRHGRALGPGRARRGHHVRHQRRLHRRLHEGRRRARRAAATSAASAPSARPAPRSRPRASTGSTSTSAPTPGCSRPAAAPTSAPPSSAASPCCRSTAASCRGGRSAPRSRPGTRTATRSSARSASWSSPSRCPRCRSTSGATRTAAATARATSRCTPASGATATGSRSPSAAPRSSTAAPTRRSTAAASAWAPSEIYRAVLAIDAIVDALVVDLPRPGTDGWMPLFVVLREGAELDDGAAARRSPAGSASAAPRATSPTRSSRSPRSRARSAARCSRCRSSGS